MNRCRSCCLVWTVGEDGQSIQRGCAHCGHVVTEWVPVDLAGDVARAAGTHFVHSRFCWRPARLPAVVLIPVQRAGRSTEAHPLPGMSLRPRTTPVGESTWLQSQR